MAFLDDIDKKLTNLGQGAIQKTKEVTDSAKLSSSIKNLEGQKKDAMADLGAICYRKCRESGKESDPEEAGVIARIDELERQLSDLRGQLQRVKGVIFCPSCHAQISPDSAFCNVCGAKIEHPAPAPAPTPQSGEVCHNCGAPIEPDQVFCVNCGTKIERKEPIPEPQPVPEPAPTQQSGAVCPNCGAEIGAGQGFCIMCGTPLKKEQAGDNLERETAPQQPGTKICPTCGKVLPDHLAFCTACGTKLS